MMERVRDRYEKMEGYCSTCQSPQRAVVPVEEEDPYTITIMELKQHRKAVHQLTKPSRNLSVFKGLEISSYDFKDLFHTSDNIDILGLCSCGMLCSVGWKLAIDILGQDGTHMLSLKVVYQLPT
jgi:hypothetical protein